MYLYSFKIIDSTGFTMLDKRHYVFYYSSVIYTLSCDHAAAIQHFFFIALLVNFLLSERSNQKALMQIRSDFDV